jgi:glycosyltransferase involved in cell wall biosynthesis
MADGSTAIRNRGFLRASVTAEFPSGRPSRISVITVVRDGAETMERCVASVERQRYAGLEYVVVDGASTDGTLEVIRRHASSIDRFVSEPDAGVYDAMNKAVRIASGDFLLFLGADDELLADLGGTAPRLSDPQTVYYGDTFWTRLGERYDGPFDARKLARRNLCQQGVFYPRSVFQRFAFDLRYPLQADWELHMRLFSDPDFRFEYLDLLVARYEDASGLSSRVRDLALEADYPRLLLRHFPLAVALPLAAASLGGRVLRRVGWLGRWST